jgi:DNA (cytosine-5)-methyltransferase 1
MKLRVFTAFSGYDSQCLALDRLKANYPDFDYELVGWSEIDKYAIQAHNALYPQWADRNYGDISKIDWSQVPDFDLFTYSSPCQDFSNAGQQKGGEEGSGTRSSLLWECRRAIAAKHPKYLLFENVANIVSKKHCAVFYQWQLELEQLGYANYAKVLNATDFEIPQNRKRIFVFSVLAEGDAPHYEFPQPLPLTRCLGDYLEEKVDEKYYLSPTAIKDLYAHNEKNKERGRGFNFKSVDVGGIAHTLLAFGGYRHTDNFIKEVKIIQRGRGFNKGGEHNIAPTITSNSYENNNFVVDTQERIRKLTPREYFRLMGVDDADIDTIQSAGISNSQQYKMAGNSIVVDVLYHIFRQAFCEEKPKARYIQQTLF